MWYHIIICVKKSFDHKRAPGKRLEFHPVWDRYRISVRFLFIFYFFIFYVFINYLFSNVIFQSQNSWNWLYFIYILMIWYHMTSYDIIWHYMLSYDIIKHHMMSYDVIWCHVIRYDDIWSKKLIIPAWP